MGIGEDNERFRAESQALGQRIKMKIKIRIKRTFCVR